MITKELFTLCVKFFRVVFLLVIFGYMNSFAQVDWTKYENNPVLLPGSPGEWDGAGLVSGCVIYEGSTLKMWYSGTNGINYRIGYATSPDGINWTKYDDPSTPGPPYAESDPVLDIGPGTFESVWVNFPQVYFDGSTYHMWYTGFDGNNYRIGYATSMDGISWIKDNPDNPVIDIGPPGSWEDTYVATGPIQFNGTNYEMIYNGSDGLRSQGGDAISFDGIVWTKDLNNPTITVDPPGSWDYPNLQPHCVVYNSFTSKYYLYYSGGQTYYWRIGYATAESFSGPWTKDSSIILDVTLGGWDSQTTAFPYAIYDPNEHIYKMWYTGGSNVNPPGTGGAIGYATATIDTTTPVELTSFLAETVGNEVLLKWSTATEINNHGFEIQRSNQGIEFFTIGFVEGNGTSTEQHNYSYKDKNINSGKYYYRIRQMDFDGSYEFSDVVEVTVAPNKFSLEQNYPNPFNPSTIIKYSISEKSIVTLKIYDMLGSEVETLVDEEKPAGSYKLNWNAANIPSGVYFYQLKTGSFVETKKMILLK